MNFKSASYIFFFFLASLSCVKKANLESVKLQGEAFGTTFHITYFDLAERDYTKQVDSLFF